jgi:hypothetical protein
MKKFLLFHTLIYLSVSAINAGNDNYPSGAASAGMGNASVTLQNLWSVSQNQAGLAGLEKIAAGVYYDRRFNLDETSVKSFALAIPVSNLGVFGAHINMFGFSLYNEKKLGVSYARKFGESLNTGVQLNYLSTTIAEDYGSNNALTVELGAQVRLLEGLSIGAHIFNPTQASLAEYDDERIPTILKIGLGYEFSPKLLAAIETEKDIDQEAMFKGGLEYRPVDQIYIRAGISTNPVMNSFGVGFLLNNLQIDIAATMHQSLGWSPHMSLTYTFN